MKNLIDIAEEMAAKYGDDAIKRFIAQRESIEAYMTSEGRFTAETKKETNMIDITKKYTTKDGTEVRLYAIHPDQKLAIHGAAKNNDGEWVEATWFADGKWVAHGESKNDLVEVKEKQAETPDKETKKETPAKETQPQIDLTKTYKTSNGYDVKLLGAIPDKEAEYGRGVIGVVYEGLTHPNWKPVAWDRFGFFAYTPGHPWDLVEVKKKQVRYININKDADGNLYKGCFHKTKTYADAVAPQSRIACVKIEFVEGQFDE
jgi:hypothetical protein